MYCSIAAWAASMLLSARSSYSEKPTSSALPSSRTRSSNNHCTLELRPPTPKNPAGAPSTRKTRLTPLMWCSCASISCLSAPSAGSKSMLPNVHAGTAITQAPAVKVSPRDVSTVTPSCAQATRVTVVPSRTSRSGPASACTRSSTPLTKPSPKVPKNVSIGLPPQLNTPCRICSTLVRSGSA
jgi:hypothetical protein